MRSAPTAVAPGTIRRGEWPVRRANLFSEKRVKKMWKRIPKAKELFVSRTMWRVLPQASALNSPTRHMRKGFAKTLDAMDAMQLELEYRLVLQILTTFNHYFW